MTTATYYGLDHETALAAGFDIMQSGYWVRPDNAAVLRQSHDLKRCRICQAAGVRGGRPYVATRGDYTSASFYTMREAVEWIGPVTEPDYLDIEWHETRP